MKLGDIDIYPRGVDPWGNDIIDAHAATFGADLVITNLDIWVLQNYGGRSFNWLPICPVAEDPLTPGNKNSIRGAINIVVISKYGQQVLKEAGFPATHIYLPVPTEFFYPIDKRIAKRAFGWAEDTYIIGHIGMNRGHRKGHDLLLRAFQFFLAEHHNAMLYLHTDQRSHDGLNLLALAEVLGISKKVIFPSRYDANLGWTPIKMMGLYNAFDLYVQPSLNEGQAMPVWEAAAVGDVVVATNATAIAEAIEGMEAIPVEPINKIWLNNDSFGYEVSADNLAEAMLKAFRTYGKNYVSVKSRQWAIENVSIEAVAQRWQEELINVEKRVRFQPVVRHWKSRPTVVQISTRIHNCGIGAYTRALMASLESHTEQECVDIFELKNAQQIPDSDIVHLHYESAISPPEQILKQVLWDLRLQGRKVLVTYHSVIPEVINYHLTNNLVDIAIIHWPPPGLEYDAKQLWVLGGMGVPSYYQPPIEKKGDIRERYGFGSDDLIISTFGFAAVGRGHYEVLEELAPLLCQNKKVHVQLIIPANFLNEEGKNIVHSRIEEIVKSYHIGRQVHLVPEFISDLEVLNRLWMSDLGFLYIDFHTSSSSAAIRFFISSRLPLVVNGSTHFEDVRRGCVRTNGFNIPEFSHVVWDTMTDENTRIRLKKEHEFTYESLVWRKFAEKYLAIYKQCLEG